MLCGFLEEFRQDRPEFADDVLEEFPDETEAHRPRIVFARDVDLSKLTERKDSYFDLTTKRYLKRRTPVEVAWIKFCLGHRARFVPFERTFPK